MNTASGRLIQNIARHPASSVSAPPTTKPLAPAAAPAALQAAIARAAVGRDGGGRDEQPQGDAGTEMAAAAPWMQRPATSAGTDPAVAAHSEPAANSAIPLSSTRRCPKRSPRRAPTMSSPPKHIA